MRRLRSLVGVTCLVSMACVSPTAPAPVAPSLERLVAFGDSLTQNGWPRLLEQRFQASATYARVRVFDEGRSGELATDASGDRLVQAIATHTPQAVVFWEGANNLYVGATVDETVAAIERNVARARAAGVRVFLVALAQQLDTKDVERIAHVNAQLPGVAARTGATLIDVNPSLSPDVYVSDGVHLNWAGHERLAHIFHDAIAQAYR